MFAFNWIFRTDKQMEILSIKQPNNQEMKVSSMGKRLDRSVPIPLFRFYTLLKTSIYLNNNFTNVKTKQMARLPEEIWIFKG